jgi:hypothetical protein
MGKRAAIVLAAVVLAVMIVPAVAFGSLSNDYGMNFAGQSKCMECHGTGADAAKFTALHAGFATQGLTPDVPSSWSVIRGAGNPPQVPGTKGAIWDGGGEYSVKGTWITLGNYKANSATEYLYWKGSAAANVMPWNLIEGLAAEPGGEWMIATEEPAKGLYDVTYGCNRCHMLGSTQPLASATATNTVPNPAATLKPTTTTLAGWSHDAAKTAADFISDPTVSYPGMSIQCESCHGTGAKVAGGHMGTGTTINTTLEVLGQSQVCGQCHGSYTNVAGTMGLYGYTPNLPLRTFVDINGKSGGQSYTKIPTVEEFMASPTAYWMFPNGSQAKGNHYYYDSWAASAHSYRGALTKDSPDAMAYQAAGNGHYAQAAPAQVRFDAKCYECHTGEGYLKSKDAKIAENFTPTADNVGFMGQECATCHGGHPSAVGAEDAVREPDKAGERSATGLEEDNTSICMDCHNWQYEVQGAKPAYMPQKDLEAHASPSHPQRETLRGYAMVEIDQKGEFMPGAKCENCHMPKTNSNANRISHGMKPMLPGDAETWMTAAGAAYKGQDSCTTCHAGSTRTDLQNMIDLWQGEAADQATATSNAIKAAEKRSEFSWTNKKTAGYILVGKATWNYKVYENDASGSVHNPEYILDGLWKAQAMAQSVGGKIATITANRALVAGRLVNGDKSPAIQGKVILYKNGKATKQWAESDYKGGFAIPISGKGKYAVVWQRASEKGTWLSSPIVVVK